MLTLFSLFTSGAQIIGLPYFMAADEMGCTFEIQNSSVLTLHSFFIFAPESDSDPNQNKTIAN